MPALLSFLGATSTESGTGRNHVIELSIDLDKALSQVQLMQKMGILNNDKPPEFFTENSDQLLVKLATLGGTYALRSAYMVDPTVDAVTLTAFCLSRDDYGHAVKRKIFDLDFTKAIDMKIDWQGFNDSNLGKVAKSFKFDPQFLAKLLGR